MYVIFILASIFTISSCGGDQGGFFLPIKKTERTSNNVEDKNLKQEKKGSIARLDTKNIVTGETQGKAQLNISPSKKIDLLFYIQNKDECTEQFRVHSSTKGFIARIGELDWLVAFSYYAEDFKGELLPLKWYNSNWDKNKKWFKREFDYGLSRQEYPIGTTYKLFQHTLKKKEQTPKGNDVFFRYRRTVSNPLGGLDHILSTNPKGVLRDDAPNVVMLFGDDFPYYSSHDWDQFFKKHKNTSVVVVGKRNSNVSNMIQSLEREDKRVVFLPCGSDDFVDLIHSKVQ